MPKHIDEMELVLMQNCPPDAWQTVIVHASGTHEYGDFLGFNEAFAQYLEMQEEIDEGATVFLSPAWNMFWHKEEVIGLMQAQADAPKTHHA